MTMIAVNLPSRGPARSCPLWVVQLALAAGLLLIAERPVVSAEPAGGQGSSAVGPLMKLFESGRLPAERVPNVVEMICNRGNENDLRVVFDRVLDPQKFSPEVRRQAVQWLTDAAETRKVRPAGDLTGIERLIGTNDGQAADAALQQAAIELASAWKDASIAPALQRLAIAADTSDQLRRAAIAGLVEIGTPDSRQTLEQLADGQADYAVRLMAAAGLVGFDLAAASDRAAKVLASAGTSDAPDALMDAFLQRKGGPDALAKALADHPLPADSAKRALRYMYSVGRSDAALSEVLSKAAGIATDTPPPTPEETAQIVADVNRLGDPARGEKIFRRKDLNCMKCHSVSRAGGQVGPELSAVGGSSPVDYIVNSILNPNLAIKEQFVTRVFILADGQVLTGVVIDRDDVRVHVRDANGQQLTIPVADIDEESEGPSLMPQGLTKFLTRDELLDLARFVSELGKPGPYGILQAKTLQRWRVLRQPPAELTQDIPHLEHLRQFVYGAEPTHWEAAYGMVSGYLPLDELRSLASQNVLILRGEIEVSQAGKIRGLVDSSARYQLWIDSDSFGDRRDFVADLPTGRHQVVLRVELPAAEGSQLKIEFQQAEGSTANFEVVNGS